METDDINYLISIWEERANKYKSQYSIALGSMAAVYNRCAKELKSLLHASQQPDSAESIKKEWEKKGIQRSSLNPTIGSLRL